MEDKIGRSEYINKIYSLINSLVEDEHFCLAVNGKWGSGKSFVLKMMEEDFTNNKEYITIKYDAWENSFYEEPLISILSSIIEDLKKELSICKGYKKVFLECGKTISYDLIDTLSKKNGNIGAIAKILKKLIDLLPTINNALNLDTDNLTKEFVSYKILLNDIKTTLNDLTINKEYNGKQKKLIILVDEIDRCLPNYQLKLLERLHHLFDIKNCVVICAINCDCVSKTVNTIYGVDGLEYLSKFFDSTYDLNTNQNIYLKSILIDFYNSLKKVCENITFDPIFCSYQCLTYGNNNVLDAIDNRQIFRYSKLLFKICLEFGLNKLNDEYIFFLIISLFIKRQLSHDFLNNEIIFKNQIEFNKSLPSGGYSDPISSEEMPYFDYINKYIGIDRRNLPDNIYKQNDYRSDNIPLNIWTFNEIIYFSLGKQFNGNAMRRFFRQPSVCVDDCVCLKNLVIKYGGE